MHSIPQFTVSRRRALMLAAASAGLAAWPAYAQQYPARAVKVIVPFGPGGPADLYARVIAQALQDALGQPFVVENRAGGGSVIGTDAVAKSPADGHTLLMMSNTHTVNETLMPNKPFRLMRDLAPVSPINYSDLVLVAKPGLGVRNLAGLVQLAKSKPGGLSYASSGPGTPYHMAGEMLKVTAGIDLLHVPYKNSAAARADVMGGQVDVMFDALPAMVSSIRTAKVIGLATTGQARSAVLPELATVKESGYTDFEATIWNGIMAPKGTPAAVLTKLNAEIRRIVSSPELVKSWAAQGVIPMTMGTAEFERLLEDDIAKWANVVKRAGVKLDQ